MRKDIKKSSYYVWFLGAQESKGLRGAEYVIPVVKSLVQRERDVEPFKVTLQVSHKGLKIVQNIPPAVTTTPGTKVAKGAKPEVVKHFIPHHAVTCVLQDDDIVACILLLYNPVTKCPVHVHAYRCDSVETAEILRGQLQTLIERPDNQKKLNEIEARLRAKGLLTSPTRNSRDPALPDRGSRALPVVSGAHPTPRRLPGGGSDGRSTSTRESESSGGSSSERLSGVGQQERIASLYDSLAAELREKLGASSSTSSRENKNRAPVPHAPILLPPRDYDTVHRQKGNLTAIDLRRCLNTNIVGVNVKNTPVGPGGSAGAGGSGARGSSGGSSGIGSDHAPSPDQQDADADGRFLDNQSSSDEEWAQPSEDSLFLVQPTRGGGGGSGGWRGADMSLPRARRVPSGGSGAGERGSERSGDGRRPAPPAAPAPAPAPASTPADARRRRHPEERQRSPSPSNGPLSPRDRFKDAKEKFLLLERERLEEQRRRAAQPQQTQTAPSSRSPPPPARPSSRSPEELPIAPAVQPLSGRRYRAGSWSRSRDSEDDLEDRPRFFPRGGHSSLRHGEDPLDDGEDFDDEDVFDYRMRSRSASNLVRRDSRGAARLSAMEEPIEDLRERRAPRAPRPESAGYLRGGSSSRDRERVERHERDRVDRERIDRERVDRNRIERDRTDRYRADRDRVDSERVDRERDLIDRDRIDRDRIDRERIDRERADQERIDRERIDRERMDRERMDRERIDRERIDRERIDRERIDRERMDRERMDRERMDRERDLREPRPAPRYAPRSGSSGGRRYEEYSPERASPVRERVLSPARGGPRPAPREEPRHAYPRAAYPEDIPLERYRSGAPGGVGPQPAPRVRADASPERRHKRRTIFDAVEEERRRASHDLAREFKRRSYQDGGSAPDSFPSGYQEIPERERFPGLDRDGARSVHPAAPPAVAPAPARAPAGYRHSYAEGNRHHELLHRAASSVSSGRVGIAAVHPY